MLFQSKFLDVAEGINDYAYLVTLDEAVRAAASDPKRADAVKEAKEFLAALDRAIPELPGAKGLLNEGDGALVGMGVDDEARLQARVARDDRAAAEGAEAVAGRFDGGASDDDSPCAAPRGAGVARPEMRPAAGGANTVPGNAVPRYRQAAANLQQVAPPREEWYAAFDRWMAAPLQDFPRDEVDGFLARCETTLREADAAARSERCDWGLTEELRKSGFAQVLSEMQVVRAVAMLFALRVRREAAEGRADRAVRALQSGLAMARHAGKSPMFIPALVGMAISAIMLGRLEELIQQPGAPNFYWPLTDLPRPFFDLRRPMQGERVWAYGCFPGTAETAADLKPSRGRPGKSRRPWPGF